MVCIVFCSYGEDPEELWDALEEKYTVCIPFRVEDGIIEIRENDVEIAKQWYHKIRGMLEEGLS